MFIVKMTYNEDTKFESVFGKVPPTYIEADTEDEAISVYTSFLSKFGGKCKVEIFGTHLVMPPAHILESVKKKMEEQERAMEELERLNLSSITYVEMDSVEGIKDIKAYFNPNCF